MDGTRAPVSTPLTGVRVRLWRFVGYFAVLRPIFVLGLIVTCLPLTTIPRVLAGTMLGNLFVEYGFWQAFWFGAVLFGAVWALMFLAGLSLDAERDRDDRWVYDPQRDQTPPSVRRVSVPIDDWRTVACFTALAAPGVLSVVAHADRGADAAVGLTLGAVAMYLVVDAGLTLLQLADRERRILPWRPLFFRCATHWFGEPTLRVAGAPARAFTALASRLARLLRVPPSFFRPGDPTTLESDHVFAAATLLFVAAVWTVLYWTLGPTGRWYAKLESLPPAGLLYLLIVFVLFLVAFVWTQFRRYRLTLYAFVALIIGVSCVQGLGGVEGGWLLGQPLHTYDVYRVEPRQAVALSEVVAPLAAVGPSASGREPTLIVVTASGGGILAAAWTTKVLGELEAAYPRLRDELRLISAVSGGSLGVVHYVLAHEGHPGSLDANALCRVVEHAACTSLAAAAYGFVFPDLYRVLSPLRVPELDRARLQERRWAAIARGGLAASSDVHLLAAWSDDIRSGAKPAVILNATVLETGERIAITPLDTLATPDGPDEPTRHLGARTLAEFLGEKAGYSVDVWTAARLSATFSYVSPPARACLRPAPAHACEDARAFGDGRRDADLHLIDGGYADDFGVASAIDWLGRELRRCRTTGSCPFDRVALVEIRAKPFEGVGATPSFGWVAEWLGPPKGLATSWAFAQRSANDTAVDLVRELDRGREIESFVFEPAPTGRACGPCAAPSSDGETPCARSFPLSWHLSRAQKACINEFWLDEPNQRTLREFLDFVGGRPAEAEQLRPFGERGGGRVSEPVDACVTGACEPGPPPP